MDKLEKVIKGLESCITRPNEFGDCNAAKIDCPYHGVNCNVDLMRDALSLLKAQQLVKPVMCTAHAQGANDVWYECGGCNAFLGINRKGRIKCPRCGKLVKWDG